MTEAARPLVFRPRRLIVWATTAAVALVGLCLFGWFGLPSALREQFETSQVVTLLLILLGLIAALVIIASSNVQAGTDGLRIRNGLATHEVDWSQVHKFLLRPGDPWAIVLIKPGDRPFEVELDAEKFQMMGIQAGDGGATEALATLTELRRRYGGSPTRPGGPDAT